MRPNEAVATALLPSPAKKREIHVRPLTFTSLQGVRNAWIIWAFVFIIIASLVVMSSNRRTVTPIYRTTTIKWFAGEDIYGAGIHGYLYLPQACILFAPFEELPFAVGEVLWRAFCIGILAAAVWRLSRFAGRGGGVDLFPLITLLVIPTALGSARNGQMNLPLAAMMAFACVDLGECRWSLAAFWLALGLALKPLIFVMLVFAAILYRPMRWRLALGILAVFAMPFLTQQASYVWTQYRLFLLKMQMAGNPGEMSHFSDIFGMARPLGITAPFAVQAVVRMIAAALTLAFCWLGLKRRGNEHGSLMFFTFNACYLLLFNPRTENMTYVVAGLPMAVFAARALLWDQRRAIAWLLIVLILVMSASYEITRGNNNWVCPGVCLVFLMYVIFLLLVNIQAPSVSYLPIRKSTEDPLSSRTDTL